mmetsp:Transcript_71700/g.149648  ORF Transcript_71700/g.149648 Transcript_71700/m.149648 type:complete len:94 (+) Transcript_71700:2285-2566(+)
MLGSIGEQQQQSARESFLVELNGAPAWYHRLVPASTCSIVMVVRLPGVGIRRLRWRAAAANASVEQQALLAVLSNRLCLLGTRNKPVLHPCRM